MKQWQIDITSITEIDWKCFYFEEILAITHIHKHTPMRIVNNIFIYILRWKAKDGVTVIRFYIKQYIQLYSIAGQEEKSVKLIHPLQWHCHYHSHHRYCRIFHLYIATTHTREKEKKKGEKTFFLITNNTWQTNSIRCRHLEYKTATQSFETSDDKILNTQNTSMVPMLRQPCVNRLLDDSHAHFSDHSIAGRCVCGAQSCLGQEISSGLVRSLPKNNKPHTHIYAKNK